MLTRLVNIVKLCGSDFHYTPTAPQGPRVTLPDFFVLGAPKAGTTAIHRAMARNPGLFLSDPKEPKFFLCDGTSPRRSGHAGPGDSHSAREWIWRRDRYEALFDNAPAGALKGESTPFYLYDLAAQTRIAQLIPQAKLIAVLRDPIDRAYSNWLHLWSDGLEPISDFVTACRAEDQRVADGWAPFWHYLRLGRYGDQLTHLFSLFPRTQVHLLRYRELVDEPADTLRRIWRFLGVETDVVGIAEPENTRPYVAPSLRARVLGSTIRAGARAGAYAPPAVWRGLSVPFTRALQRGGGTRPELSADARRQLVDSFADDVARLEELTGWSLHDWTSDRDRGAYLTRRVTV